MKESYKKGVANHPGPEPCEGSREAALEALDRGIGRLGIDLRNLEWRQPVGKATQWCALGRAQCDPAESKTPSMPRNSTRENRETPLPPEFARRRAGGRKR